ncbi:MAG: TIGR01212 family radical SAM protein [Candidatus Ornithospirochaeta sp.]
MKYTRWNSYRDYLEKKYGTSLYRVGVDGGFSCPNRSPERKGGCTFCDGTGSVAVYQRTSESAFRHDSSFDSGVSEEILLRFQSMENQIKKGLEFIKRRYGAELAALYFQSWTNTYDSVENLKLIYDRALSYYDFSEFIVSTRPDTVEDEKIDLLASYIRTGREVWVELGLQSASDKTLESINRGHTLAQYVDACRRLHGKGIKICTHVILGLPGEDRTDFLKTAEVLNKVGSEGVKIHNLHIPGGTRMAWDYLEGEVVSWSTERYLMEAEFFIRNLSPDIVVERLVCETPSHRLMAPRHFMDKSQFLNTLEGRMTLHGTKQGDLYEG